MTEAPLFQMSVRAHASELAAIRRAVADESRKLGAEEDSVARMEIAVGEACSNVVSHAYEAHDETGTIEVTAWAKGSKVVFSIRDHGTPMAQRSAGSTGAGLGLYLIGSLSDDCELRNPDDGGTEILIGFHLNEDDRFRLIREVLPER